MKKGPLVSGCKAEKVAFFWFWGGFVVDPGKEIQVSHEKKPGWLGFIGDEILPSCIGIVISHYKNPY